MSRRSSEHIRSLEDVIRAALAELAQRPTHEQVWEPSNPNCQCGACRARRVLGTAILRTKDS
jgi:hypothetical protein